ncbi:phospholipase D-like domain-containing protein [Phycisphaera mikurensis]|uniref:Putative cardiolipin synthase n=1 Tax=Phycisphaera mikurensis (strain NBRC 102666 / KCTC 22515 / FYK2301M01) TaxID=1142394 RepID=I0IIZ4_PHYMF|nr:phospholipase D-like domain-containing protein [Phycisphaera mikurensis]MBB6443079.1 cardiolipin synthase [Phycisphaera mikurensis]BAM05232.1 putative cardiolipin synthase [Phycisphaera mikurensis NBRC 102666]
MPERPVDEDSETGAASVPVTAENTRAVPRLQIAMTRAMGMPFFEGNRVTRIMNGEDIFEAMLGAIDGAELSIDLSAFIFWESEITERFIEALCDAARRGVRVRVLADGWGGHFVGDHMPGLLEDAGAQFAWFRPLKLKKGRDNFYRSHRRVLAIDNTVAFTGGVGFADHWTGDAEGWSRWRDSHFRIEGPAVEGLRAGFEEHWVEEEQADVSNLIERPTPMPAGPASLQVIRADTALQWNDIATAYQALVRAAAERLWISTAYFTPDPLLVNLIKEADGRGVDVRVMIPSLRQNDKWLATVAAEDTIRFFAGTGVRFYRYKPTMLHAKSMVIDDRGAVFGSANFNHRSMMTDDELIVVAVDTELNATLAADFETDLAECDPVDPADFERVSLKSRLARVLTRWKTSQV